MIDYAVIELKEGDDMLKNGDRFRSTRDGSIFTIVCADLSADPWLDPHVARDKPRCKAQNGHGITLHPPIAAILNEKLFEKMM